MREVEDMNEATAGATIQRLRAMFARFGIPESLVSDNGPCFISKEFKDFLRKNGVMHITSAPYHPASNGLAERAVRIVKEGLRKMKTGAISDKIARLLFQYRMTPQSVTKLSPAELLLGRCLTTVTTPDTHHHTPTTPLLHVHHHTTPHLHTNYMYYALVNQNTCFLTMGTEVPWRQRGTLPWGQRYHGDRGVPYHEDRGVPWGQRGTMGTEGWDRGVPYHAWGQRVRWTPLTPLGTLQMPRG